VLPDSPGVPRLQAAEVVAGRFRIVRFLGRGGMGEVYEAEDLTLRVNVALKTLRSDLPSDALPLLHREIVTARAITHPGVCRVFDLFRHRLADGELSFLTMELLEGETLSERLARDGALSEPEALLVARGVCAALRAAHEVGVTHGDLRSRNVMLVRGQGSGGLRVVVTDFGLARASVASDLDALGALLQELASAARPAPRPSAALPRLARRLLDADPAMRCASAAEALAELEDAPSPPLPRRRASLALLAAAAALAVGVAIARRVRTAHPAGTARRSVAVLPLRNAAGSASAGWLGTALAEMLEAELGAGERLRVVPGESVSRSRREMRLADGDALGADALRLLGRSLAAEVVIEGSYTSGPGSALRLELLPRTTVPESAPPSAIVVSGSEDRLGEVVALAGTRLRAVLRVPEASAAESASAARAFPVGEAARLYAGGLERLRAFDAPGARDLLAAAVAREPQNPLAHLALSTAFSRLGQATRAREEAQRALESSASLPREQVLLIEGRCAMVLHQRERAIDAYRRLFGVFSDNLEYGLFLAEAQAAALLGREAQETLRVLRALPPPSGEDPRIDLTEASAASALGDMHLRQEASARAAAKARATGARLLLAEARSREGSALSGLGRPAEAAAAYDEARRTFAEMGDANGVARAGHRIAELLMQQGDFASALGHAGESLRQYRALDNAVGELWAIQAEADALAGLGELGRARGRLVEAAPLLERVNATASQRAGLLGRLGRLDLEEGKLADARRHFTDGYALERSSESEIDQSFVELNLGELARAEGHLEDAACRLGTALSTWRRSGDRSLEARTLRELARVELDRGELEAARGHLLEALATQQELEETGALPVAQLRLAEVLLEQGSVTEAARALPEACAALRGRPQLEALGRALAARAARLSGDLPAAARELEAAGPLAAGGAAFEARLVTTLEAARLDLAHREPPRAAREAARLEQEARRAGHLELALEAALVRVEAERRAAGARALEREASAAGFALIAGKAMLAAAPVSRSAP